MSEILIPLVTHLAVGALGLLAAHRGVGAGLFGRRRAAAPVPVVLPPVVAPVPGAPGGDFLGQHPIVAALWSRVHDAILAEGEQWLGQLAQRILTPALPAAPAK